MWQLAPRYPIMKNVYNLPSLYNWHLSECVSVYFFAHLFTVFGFIKPTARENQHLCYFIIAQPLQQHPHAPTSLALSCNIL